MSLDDPRNPRDAHLMENPDDPAWALILDRPRRRNPARNYGDDLDRYKDLLDEKILGLVDELACVRAERARLDRVDVDFDPDPGFRERPGIDPRMFATLGTDATEPRLAMPRSVVDVETGGRT